LLKDNNSKLKEVIGVTGGHIHERIEMIKEEVNKSFW